MKVVNSTSEAKKYCSVGRAERQYQIKAKTEYQKSDVTDSGKPSTNQPNTTVIFHRLPSINVSFGCSKLFATF